MNWTLMNFIIQQAKGTGVARKKKILKKEKIISKFFFRFFSLKFSIFFSLRHPLASRECPQKYNVWIYTIRTIYKQILGLRKNAGQLKKRSVKRFMIQFGKIR